MVLNILQQIKIIQKVLFLINYYVFRKTIFYKKLYPIVKTTISTFVPLMFDGLLIDKPDLIDLFNEITL